MKQTDQQGSVLVLFLVFCVSIMAIAFVALRSGSVLFAMVHDRIRWIQHMRATQALVYYGIADCRQKKHTTSFTSIMAPWPPSGGNFQGKLHIEALSKGYCVTGTLMQAGRMQCVMQATIKQEKDQWTIAQWKEG